jgi:hypothetical protein
MNDDELDGPNRVYDDPDLLEDFLQHILWPFLDFGPDTLAFFTNRSDLSDFLPGMTDEDYQTLVDAINQRYGIAMQTRDCGRIYQILERIRDDERANKVWQQHQG